MRREVWVGHIHEVDDDGVGFAFAWRQVSETLDGSLWVLASLCIYDYVNLRKVDALAEHRAHEHLEVAAPIHPHDVLALLLGLEFSGDPSGW